MATGDIGDDDLPECDCGDDECPVCNTDCWHCHGEGWGVVGDDWDSDDYINGPYDGEVQKCPNCRGSGKAKDCTFW
jgi:hypothetical protein